MSRFLSRNSTHTGYLAQLALALLPFVVFWSHTLAARSWYDLDIQFYFLPYHQLVVDMLWAGHLPLWNPYAFAGIPLMADGQTALWYPPNWLFLVLPNVYALNIVTLLQFSIAGLGMWSFSRSIGLKSGPAFIAALAFMFGGVLTARVVQISLMAGAALVPWVFWGVERLLQQASPRRLVLAGGCVALQAVSGHPQLPAYTALAIGVYVAVDTGAAAWVARSVRPMRNLALLAATYVIGMGFSAIQIVPWADFALLSPRAAGASFEFVTSGSIRGPEWFWWIFPHGPGVLTPSLFGQTVVSSGGVVPLWERSAYVGMTPLILCFIAVLGSFRSSSPLPVPRQRLWALLAVLLLGMLVAAGSTTPVGRLVYSIPIVGKFRFYQRAIVLTGFAVCALAGWGAQRITLATPGAWRRLRWEIGVSVFAIGGVAAAIVLLANAPTLLPSIHRRTEFWRNLPPGAPQTWVPLLLIAVTGIMLICARRRRGPWPLVTVVALDLGLYTVTFNPSIDPKVLNSTPNSVIFLRNDPSLYRTASFMSDPWASVPEEQAQLAFSWNIAYRIASINGFNSLEPRRNVDLLVDPNQEDVSYGYLRDPGLLQSGHRLLSLLNVKYVLFPPDKILTLGPHFTPVFADQHVAIYRNEDVLPRAFWATAVQPAAPLEILTALRSGSIDPGQVALVEDIDPALADSLQASKPGGPVSVTMPGPNHLVITATTPVPRFLVVAEPWMRGWQAYINDRPVATYRTDYLLRGIVVPAGTHTVTFRYRPASVQVGTLVSSATLLLAGFAFIHRRRVANTFAVTDAV